MNENIWKIFNTIANLRPLCNNIREIDFLEDDQKAKVSDALENFRMSNGAFNDGLKWLIFRNDGLNTAALTVSRKNLRSSRLSSLQYRVFDSQYQALHRVEKHKENNGLLLIIEKIPTDLDFVRRRTNFIFR
ncbi:hypothetical protein WA026_021451 [Henosepilachna vigintioctopunctata]|uniref:Uncharacterized protein n=1 Tax=Henosepilachna vigintioctopunctata TaxID=420089 RepID=A0AAW1TSA8_9CUCU